MLLRAHFPQVCIDGAQHVTEISLLTLLQVRHEEKSQYKR